VSVRRRAIQERKDRDGMRRAEYERTMRWLRNVQALVHRKLLFDDNTVTAAELAACFDDESTASGATAVED
jgi:hypothetical protein